MPVCPECKNSLDAGANICNRCQTEFVFCQTQGCPLYGDPQIAKNKPCAGGCGTPLMAGRAHYVAPPPTMPPTSPTPSGNQAPQPPRPGINVEQGILDGVTIDQRNQTTHQAITHNYGPTETLVECRGCGRKIPERKTFRCKYCNLPNFCEDYCAKVGPNGPSFGLWCGQCQVGHPTPYPNPQPWPGNVPPPPPGYGPQNPPSPGYLQHPGGYYPPPYPNQPPWPPGIVPSVPPGHGPPPTPLSSDPSGGVRRPDREEKEKDLMRRKFYTSLLERARSLTNIYPSSIPAVQKHINARISGYKFMYITNYVKDHHSSVYVVIDTWDSVSNKKIYDQLYANRIDIESEMGGIIRQEDWKRKDEVRACEIGSENIKNGLVDQGRWDEIQDEMIRRSILFDKVLSIKLKNITY